MIIAIDCETQGLDATKFIMGCIAIEGRQRHETYYNKKKLWKRVLEIAKAEAKREKVLYVYSHNAAYDTAAYVDFTDKNMHYFSQKPFIWTYKENGKEIIKFLDTMNIYEGSLKQLGELIGHPKQEMPQKLYKEEGQTYTQEELKEMGKYCINDATICLKAILHLKEKLKKEKINIKRLQTKSQIAINYVMNEINKLDEETKQKLYWKKGELRRTIRPEKIHAAYRGGRNEAWKYGTYEGITWLDCNSLYPYAIMTMKFPDITTEQIIYKPLLKTNKAHIIGKLGISRALIYNNNNELGILPIRTPDGNYFIQPKQYAIGTWTNEELQTAETNGHDIIDIEWSIIWEEMKNPLKEIYENIYKRRKQATTPLENGFYKIMMNHSIGKFAQTKTGQEYSIDSVEAAQDYLKKGYEIMRGIGYNYLYKKIEQNQNKKPKPYYFPIIPTLCNARARLYMYNWYKEIGKDKLLYTDTDSLIYIGNDISQIDIGSEIGKFKIVERNTNCLIYGNKTIRIGNEIKIAGTRKHGITAEDFQKGQVQDKQMITVKTAKKIEDIGKFTTTTRNLKETTEKNLKTKVLYENEKLLIDNDIKEIMHFLPKVGEILK